VEGENSENRSGKLKDRRNTCDELERSGVGIDRIGRKGPAEEMGFV